MRRNVLVFHALLFSLWVCSWGLYAQVVSTTNEAPSNSFSGEQFCFEAALANTGNVGYGPYYRLILPASITLDSATLFGQNLNSTNVGTFPAEPGNTLTDPLTQATISGTQGHTYYNLPLPIGAVVASGPALVSTLCLTLDENAAIGDPLTVALQPVYLLGDTATGDNGPIEGASATATVTPSLFSFGATEDSEEKELATGADFPASFSYTVNVANGKTLNNVSFVDTLAAGLQFVGPVSITGGTGCVAVSEPSVVTPGGTLQVDCTSLTGTASNAELTVSYPAYIPDVLSGSTCNIATQTNTQTLNGSFNGNGLPQASLSTGLDGKHLAIQQANNASSAIPGDTVTFTDAIQVSSFATANSLTISDTLPDGFTFAAHSAMTVNGNNTAITPSVVANGTTSIVYDIHGVTGDLAPGTEILIAYTATIDEDFNNAPDPVLANDLLVASTQAAYSLVSGVTGCSENSGSRVDIATTTASKTLLAPQANYLPGDTATFRLQHTIPSGDSETIVFQDFLPLPVFDVNEVNTTFGIDITRAATDTAGLVPSNIAVDGATNSVTITWPNLHVDTSESRVIAVDLAATVTNRPFADDLALVNILQVSNVNSASEVQSHLVTASIQARAPELVATLGVSASNNATANASITPAATILPVDGDITATDAGDVTTFVLTIENVGGDVATEVVATVAAVTGMSNATLVSVVDGDGSPLATSGSLESGLSVADLAANDGTPGAPFSNDTAIITFTRIIDSSIAPRAELSTSATVDYTADNSGNAYPQVDDDSSTGIADPTIASSIDSIVPGAGAPSFVVGDTVTFANVVNLPEGQTDTLVLTFTLPAGMQYSSTTVDTTGFAGTVDTSPTEAVSGTVAAGQQITLTFDAPAISTVTNDNNTSNNSFAVNIATLVVDDAANAATSAVQAKNLASALSYNGFSGAAVNSAASGNFSEHDLSVATSVSPAANLDAGDTVTVSVVVTNNGTAPAYDLTVTDIVNSGSSNLFILSSVASGSIPAGYSFNYSNPTVTISADNATVLAPGAAVTFTYTATVQSNVITGSSLNVDAEVSGNSQEDGGGGTTRSATDSSSATATVSALASDAIELIDSSEAWTADSAPIEAAIGEVLTYAYTVTIPEGVTDDPAANNIIEVTLPAGYQFITGTGFIRGVFDSGITGANVGAISGSNAAIVPGISGQVLSFDLGDVTNTDSDANDEQIVVTFDVVVANTSDNNRTDSKSIVGAVHYNNAAGNPQTATSNQSAAIAESNITVTKNANPASVAGGDTVTFTVVATNTIGTNVTRAWEWQFIDNLPADLLNPAVSSATLSRSSTDITACASFTSNQLQVNDTCIASASDRYLAAGESITVVYTAVVDNSIGFEETITNMADVLVSSLPGTAGTGGASPGTAGSDTGERIGSGNNNTSGQAVNDLVVMASGSVTSSAPTMSLTSSGTELPIGTDNVLLTAQLSMPVGTTNNFVFTLDLPTGLRYNGNAIALTNIGSLSTSNTVATTQAAGTDPIVLDFGTVTNSTGSGVNLNIAVPVTIENVLANQNGTMLTANGSVTYQNISSSVSDTAVVTVVEPNLTVNQTITAGATGSDAGDTISYQTTIQNTSASATAFRVNPVNLLPAGLLGNANGYTSVAVNNPGDVVVLTGTATPLSASDFTQSTTNNANDTLSAGLFDIPPSTTLTITYNAEVASAVSAGQTLTNSFSASYHSLSDGSGRDGSTANSDDDTNTDLNNYNESDSAILTLDASTSVQAGLNSTHSGSTFTIGDTVIFDIRVDVIEGSTGNMVVTTTLPDGLSFVSSQVVAGAHISFDGAGTVVEAPTGTLTTNFGTLTNNADSDGTNDFYILEVTTIVDDVAGNTDGTTLTTSAALTSDAGAVGPDTQAITVGEPNLVVTIVPDNASASLGDLVTLTVTVAHDSSQADAFETLLTLNIPNGLTLVTASHTGAGAIDESDTTAPVINLGTITQADTSKTFALQVSIDEDVNINDPLSVSISSGQYSSQSGTPTVEREYTLTGSTPVTGNTNAFIAADQRIVLLTDNNGNGIADSGDVLQIEAVITNNGANASNVVFTEAVPANTTYVASSLSATTGTPNDADTSALTVAIGSLNNSASTTVTFNVTVNAGVPAGLIVLAQGSVDSSETVPEPTDNDGIDSNGDQANQIRVGSLSNDIDELYIAQSFQLVNDADGDNNVSPGDTLTLFYDVQNTGSTTLNNLTLIDTIPAGLTYVGASASVTGGGNSAAVNAGALSTSITAIEPLQSEQVSFNVTVDGPLSGTSQTFELQGTGNSDETSSLQADSNGIAADGSQPVLIHATANSSGTPVLSGVLTYTLANDTDGDGNVDDGDTLLLTAIIQNTGSAIANNVNYDFAIPGNTTLITGTGLTSQGAIALENPLSVNVGNLPVGSTATVQIQVTVNNGVANGTVLSAQGAITSDNSAAVNTDDNGNAADGISATLIPILTSGTLNPEPVLTYTNITDGTRTSGNTFVQSNVVQIALTVTFPVGVLQTEALSITVPSDFSYVNNSARLIRHFDSGLIAAANPGSINTTATDTAVNVHGVISNVGNVLSIHPGTVINSDSDVNDETLTFLVQLNTSALAPTTASENFTFTGEILYRNPLSAHLSSTDTHIIALENRAPNAIADSATVAEDSSSNTLNPIANDSDDDTGQTIDITAVSVGNNGGTLVLNGDNSVTYSPAADFSGTETFTYTLSDGITTSAGTFTITVTGSNDAPSASNDSASTSENSAIASLNVLSNDTDPDGDSLQVTTASAVNGVVIVNGDNTLQYTPDNGFIGTDTISYTISDGNGETDTATVTVTVSEVVTNTPPSAINDSAGTDEDNPVVISVLANDSDANGDSFSVTSASSSQGSVVINSNNTLSFTPNADFNGQATISYSISDGNGGVDSATVSVTVSPVNDSPTAENDTVTVQEDSLNTAIDVLSNDTDVDGDILLVTTVVATNGVATVNADGTVNYTPFANFNGTDTISYTVSDGNGGTTTATVNVNVLGVNDVPLAVDDSITVSQSSSNNQLNVLANDTDVDGDILTVVNASVVNGSVIINPDNTLGYTPNPDFTGTEILTYTISDGNGGTATATVVITVGAGNVNPVASNDSVESVEDMAVVLSPLNNDTDADGDTLTITSASSEQGSVVINADGTLLFEPEADFNGLATVEYRINDGRGGSSSATISVNVEPVEDPPQATADLASVGTAGFAVINVLDNDLNPDAGNLSIVEASSPNGEVVINDDGTLTFTPNTDFNGETQIRYTLTDDNNNTSTAIVSVSVNTSNNVPEVENEAVSIVEDAGQNMIDVLNNDTDIDGDVLLISEVRAENGEVNIADDGRLVYTPNSDFSGNDTIQYTVSDGNGGLVVGTVTVNVAAVNDPPVASNDTASVGTSGTTTINVLANDTDADNDTLTISEASSDQGNVEVNSDGTLIFESQNDFSGTAIINYVVTDGSGGTSSATVTVTVNTSNALPVAQPDSAVVQEDSSTNIIDVLGNDSDSDGDTLSVSNASALNGSITVNSDGTITYEPHPDFNGIDTITYTVSDGNGGAVTGTVTVTVTAVNDAPVAVNDAISVEQNSEGNLISPVANDSDPDDDQLTIIQATAENGSVVLGDGGVVQYTPNSGFVGTDTLTYTVSDGNGGETTATVTINVNGANQPPVVSNDSAAIESNTSTTLFPLDNDSDPDGDTLVLESAATSNGQAVVNADGSVTFTPAPGFTGVATIEYVVNDGNGNRATGVITVDVIGDNRPPVINPFEVSTQVGVPVTIDMLSVASDPDLQAITISSASVDSGSVVINSDGSVIFTPDPGFQGSVNLEVCVVDTLGAQSCATFVISVVESNLPPEAFNFTFTINEDETLALNLTGRDPENQALTYQQLSDPVGELTGDYPRLVYVPPAHFSGSTSFSYQANDGELDSNVATVTITVLPVNDPPIAVADNLTIQFAQPVTISPLSNDFHPDNDDIFLVGATTALGSITFDGDTLIFTPLSGFVGDAVINYSISDSDGDIASATITVTVLVDESTFFPIITLPDDVFVDANALFTKIDLGVASAVDRFGNPLPVSTVDGVTFYEPGNNTAFWRATDDEGRTSIASQSVRVRPLVSLEKDQQILEGHSVAIGVHLNGASPVYPLEVPYTVTGTADSDDHNLASGSIVFESGSDATIEFDVFADLIFEGQETIVVTLSDQLNRGNKFQHVITINEDNVDPNVTLFPTQNNEERATVGTNDGEVTVVSTVEHPDPDRAFTYNWQSLDGNFVDSDDELTTFTFDVSGVDPGVYRIRLDVADSQAPEFNDNDTLFINVVATLPVLDPNADSDSDGIPDGVEGLKDTDNDGIPDFNDPVSECNVVPQEVDFVDGFMLEGDPGVCLRLGNFSIESVNGGGKITDEDINNLPGIVPDTDALNVGGIFDFIAYGLPEEGSTHKIVTPLLNPIPQNAVYRKFMPDTGWGNFVVTDRDKIWSSPGEPGYCFPPGGDIWVEGLVEDYWCVQVEIVDGGPNDADGLANGTVVDPGGVSVLLGSGVVNQQPQANDDFATAAFNIPVLVDVLANDTDPDGDTLTVTSASPNFGTAEIVNNQVRFTPPTNYLGDIQIGYGISDNSGGSSRATIFITVTPLNQPPVAQNDAITAVAGEATDINVLVNDSDPDGESIRVISVAANDGVAVISESNVIRFTPNADFAGSTILIYQIEDASGGIDEAIVTVTVVAAPEVTRIENTGGGGAVYWLVYLLMFIAPCKCHYRMIKKRKGK